ncbi:HupE/UreJ family protein [Streptomyces sp. L7]
MERRSGGPRAALTRIGRITLAFTVGHSVALAASALTRLQIPGRPVEAFIAASILVGAVHAIRPLFPGKEALVAGVFGLGHGMAFSFVLAEMHLSTGQLASSLSPSTSASNWSNSCWSAWRCRRCWLLARLRASSPPCECPAALITATRGRRLAGGPAGDAQPGGEGGGQCGAHTTGDADGAWGGGGGGVRMGAVCSSTRACAGRVGDSDVTVGGWAGEHHPRPSPPTHGACYEESHSVALRARAALVAPVSFQPS